MKAKKIIVPVLALAIVIGIAVWMFIIGRAHTIYFDNKTLEYDGTTYKPFYTVEIFIDGNSVAKLREEDRGMFTITGQKLEMQVHITPKKGGKKVGSAVTVPIEYGKDGVVLNIPAMFQQAPAEAYMYDFVPLTPSEPDTEDVVVDEFTVPAGDE